ncbi:MAG: glycine cleavage system protein H [Bacteroidota bacterium]
MVILLFILMLVIFLTAEYFFFSKKISGSIEANTQARLPVSTEIIERYFHRGHSWVLVQSSKEVIAGIDDFAQRCIGRLGSIELPRAGSVLRQGETMVTMKHGSKSLSTVAPVSGTILEVNARLGDNPSIINDSPLEKGWIVKIAPQDLAFELHNLFKGVIADRWQEAVRAHLVHWLSPHVGPVMQDGGDIVDNVSDLVNGQEWHLLIGEFFPKDLNDTHNNNT